MRTVAGILVLVLGVGVAGYWARGNNAVRIERAISDSAAKVATSATHQVTASVSGRDIHISGIADSDAEKQRLLAALDGVEGRRVVTEDLRVLERASPFTLDVTKSAASAPLVASGSVPSEKVRAGLGLGGAAAALKLASGAPAGWEAAARSGIEALGLVNSGRLTLADDRLRIEGVVNGPNERAAVDAVLARLPAGTVDSRITMLDDGTPPAWTLNYNAFDGATIAGKLPRGLDIAAIAQALGLPRIGGEVRTALLGEPGDTTGLGAFRGLLAKIERLSLDVSAAARKATVEVQIDDDATDVRDALKAGGVDATVTTVTPKGRNGETRVNAATGASERFMGGYWLVLPEAGKDIAACQTSVNTVLAGVSINFVTGSDRLDSRAVRAINELARFMVRCIEDLHLKAEIGGHTDNVGDDEANLELSQRRAAAVRDQLVSRGVAGTALVARGYGVAQPVADNDTPEGRARNRRTSIIWSN